MSAIGGQTSVTLQVIAVTAQPISGIPPRTIGTAAARSGTSTWTGSWIERSRAMLLQTVVTLLLGPVMMRRRLVTERRKLLRARRLC